MPQEDRPGAGPVPDVVRKFIILHCHGDHGRAGFLAMPLNSPLFLG